MFSDEKFTARPQLQQLNHISRMALISNYVGEKLKITTYSTLTSISDVCTLSA